ncbi:hypothetical protein DAEQUDRAFT_740136 [Daedalea quercina L-15889]|uniref:Histone chaperone RTT106/FACT complex subunit SPT16-like middle domain-containing protein n=1 Tax=Daedalea quercina L-15889 TaxID=1314783 RepID=A0A165MV89_9APHY|nr:hypothetical protein DAEQUDRAFT_740136 [Daedalea quercina L-15889]
MPDSAIEYFHAVVPSAPLTLRKHLLALPHDTVHAVDALLRFVLDAPCPPTAPWDDHTAWAQAQNEVAWRIAQLRKNAAAAAAAAATTAAAATANASTSAGHKRSHDEASPAPPASTSTPAGPSKRPKIDDTAAPPADTDDPPLFTLHALSVTSPIRKKADITIHANTLRLTTGPARTPEAPPVPLAALRRAFLLPTRGKSKPHWTVLFMPSDVPVAPGKAGAEARERERTGAQAPLVAFGVDAVPSAPLTTTTYPTPSHSQPQTTVHPRGAPAEPPLRAFLAHFHTPPLEPRTDVFRSAASAGAGAADVAGVEAYRGAKPGTLWFLSEGILWDGRPAEFFALRDVAPGAAGGDADADAGADAPEGVRTLSATGRTCSVLIRRRGDEEDDEGGESEARVAEVDFGMVDGKEQEGIARWVRRHRHLFGRAAAPPRAGAGPSDPTVAALAAANDADEDEEDAEDEDFVASESDDGSATSESDGDGSGAETVDEDGGGAEAGGDEEEEEEEEGALDPAHHPLLRPGALAMRISRAAMELAVGIVEQDFVGSPAGDGDEEGDEDEEDELED